MTKVEKLHMILFLKEDSLIKSNQKKKHSSIRTIVLKKVIITRRLTVKNIKRNLNPK